MKSRNQTRERPTGSWSRRKTVWSLALAPVVIAGGGLAWFSSGGQAPPSPAAARAPRETRLTLEPALFTGKARQAHAVARVIPDVLDQLRCYCRCEGIGHVSLLSCYTDGHAAT